MPDIAPTRESSGPLAGYPRAPRSPRWRRNGEDDLVVAMVTQHAESVLRITRRISLCDDDAQDAYQRALEILIRNAERLDPHRAASWLRTVARHEALAIREQRQGAVEWAAHDPDQHEDTELISPEEQLVRLDRFSRSAEALRDLKPDEVRALWLRAEGYSYAEIASANSWSYTKVNRLLAEGRARFLARYATIESGGACAEWRPVLSMIVDGEARAGQRRDAAAHLRSCAGCRGTLRELRSAAPGIRSLFPVGLLTFELTDRRSGGSGVVGFFEGLFGSVHDRAAMAAANAQGAVDAIGAGKLAAVTASVAAVTGGGAVAVEQASDPVRSRSAKAARVSVARRPPRLVAARAVATAAPATPLRPVQHAEPPSHRAAPKSTAKASSHTAHAHHVAPKSEFTKPVPSAAPASAQTPGSGSDFSGSAEFSGSGGGTSSSSSSASGASSASTTPHESGGASESHSQSGEFSP